MADKRGSLKHSAQLRDSMSVTRSKRRDSNSILMEIWLYRELFRSLVIRDLKVKYQRSLFGLIWTVLNPLFTVTILVTVFSYVIRIQIDHYWAFLISGFFVWNFISQSLNFTTTILANNASLSRNVYFPREVLILSAAVSKLVEFLLEITIVLIVLFIFHHGAIPASLILLPFLIFIQVILVVGLMFPLAVLAVLFYDIQHALPILITSLFYLSPVFYPVTMIPEVARPFYYINPFVTILRLYHVVLYEGAWPSIMMLGSAFVSAVAICLIGYWIFNRFKGVCNEIA